MAETFIAEPVPCNSMVEGSPHPQLGRVVCEVT
jgi:hypothetical protein